MTPPSRIPPNQQLVRPNSWPLVGERHAQVDDRPWTLTIAGCVQQPLTWDLHQLSGRKWQERRIDIHCVTRWSKLDVRFRGIPLSELLEETRVLPEANFISFVARSDRRHSTSLPLAETIRREALIAFEVEGKPLPPEHGGPMRVVVPGKYFYKSVKWLETIELLEEDRLGYWEATAGYHNEADPWKEQRYMAATLTRSQAARLIQSRDFANQDLRSIDARGRDLAGLNAQNAQLRDANFRQAQLANANFFSANLANAHFNHADLQAANFTDADIEGADFAGADLRGTNLRVASMFGASFCRCDELGNCTEGAQIDSKTQLDAQKFDALTPAQRHYLEARVIRPPTD